MMEKKNATFSLQKETRRATVEGWLTGASADELMAALCGEGLWTLDFTGVNGIDFAALRSLLRNRRQGVQFFVINVCDSVAEMFETTGVSAFIGVCRQPGAFSLEGYTQFGGSFISNTYNAPDGDSMRKVYKPCAPEGTAEREKLTARACLQFGIPTPMSGCICRGEEGISLDFERITGKRSFARVISEESERLEEISVRFAQMCKQLHATPCDTALFPDRTLFYSDVIRRAEGFTTEEKERMRAFLESVPRTTTCLHGDMHIGNVITTGRDDLWIDMSDFSYGNPLFDVAMMYFTAYCSPEDMVEDLYHITAEQFREVYRIFAREYFGADTPEKFEAANEQMKPFCALHMLFLGTTYGFMPFMYDYIHTQMLP